MPPPTCTAKPVANKDATESKSITVARVVEPFSRARCVASPIDANATPTVSTRAESLFDA
jgi:hypothetical protein